MSFLDKITARIPFGKQEEVLEYFFALNILNERLICALWTIEKKQLKIEGSASENYDSLDNLTPATDKLLDQVLDTREIDVQKILFGVPSSWLSDGNLKEEYLKILRKLVKDLDLTPMAYVENSQALVHFLEKIDGVPPTAILVGFEAKHLTVAVVRAGKLDGVKIIKRGDNSGADIEKALLTFVNVETLPSKILLYGQPAEDWEKLKSGLLSFSWMSKLSFLHFPKIEILDPDVEIKSVCLAGASELEDGVSYTEQSVKQDVKKSTIKFDEDIKEGKEEAVEEKLEQADLNFVVGDISEVKQEESAEVLADADEGERQELETNLAEIEDFETEIASPPPAEKEVKLSLRRFIPKRLKNIFFLIGLIGVLLVTLGAYLFLPKAEVKIFVEPKVIEKDTQVTADPNQKTVSEESKIIPGQLVETEVLGSLKGEATGKKQIGDAAKGTVIVRNKTDGVIALSKGTTLTANGLKFNLDTSVNIASRSADDGTWGKATTQVTAQSIGADGNLPSGSDMLVSGYSQDKLIAKAEGNFSGGTSKDVTVVSSDDQKRLLASLASSLRKQAQQKLQEKLPEKKILEEALSEELVKKTYSKNINDQASEFSLNLTAKYKGVAFEDKDLKLIVSKLVTTQVPEGFQLNLEDTETQADVSKLEKDGKLIFLARFKAKLMPKIDTDKVKNQIKGKSAAEANNIIKGMENILGSEITISPKLPPILQRLPLLLRNIKIEVGLK